MTSAHLEKVQGTCVSVGQQQVTPQNTQGFIWTHKSVRCVHTWALGWQDSCNIPELKTQFTYMTPSDPHSNPERETLLCKYTDGETEM